MSFSLFLIVLLYVFLKIRWEMNNVSEDTFLAQVDVDGEKYKLKVSREIFDRLATGKFLNLIFSVVFSKHF